MKKLIAIFFVSTCAMAYANTQLGSHSLSSTSGIANLIAVGRNAASESKNSSHSIFIGNNSGYAVSNLNNVIAIGGGATVGARNLSGVVAIGDHELANVGGLSDTTSINKQQLFVSGVANAFSINPRQESSITNTPLHYIGGEMKLKADKITLQSKGSVLMGKKINTDIESFNVPLDIQITNRIESADKTYIHHITNCNVYITHYIDSGDYNLSSISLSLEMMIYKLVWTNNGQDISLSPVYPIAYPTTSSFGDLRLLPGVAASTGNDALAKVEVLDDFSLQCFLPVEDGPLGFKEYVNVRIPLDRLLEDIRIDPILHQSVKEGETNSLVSSAAVHDYVDERLNGITLKIENGALVVYQNGTIIGRLTLGN